MLSELRRISQRLVDNKALASKLKDGIPKRVARNYEKELDKIGRRIEDMKKQFVESYQDKLQGVLSEDDFLLIRDTINRQRKELINQREDIAAKLLIKKDNLHDHEKVIQQLLAFDVPNRTIITQLVEKITIYHHGNDTRTIKIQYTFSYPFEN